MIPGMDGLSARRSSCLPFPFLSVETFSLLPKSQSNRCDRRLPVSFPASSHDSTVRRRVCRRRNGPAAIHSLQPIHDACEIFVDRQVAAGQFLQGAYACLSRPAREAQRAAARPASAHRSDHSCCRLSARRSSADCTPAVPSHEARAGRQPRRGGSLLEGQM